jgi:hypothetical protein
MNEHENFLVYNFSITNTWARPGRDLIAAETPGHLCRNSVQIDLVSLLMGALLSRRGQ